MFVKPQILMLAISIGTVLYPASILGQVESISRQQKNARRAGGIRAAAKVTGNYVSPAQFHVDVVAGLDTLVYDSSAVIVGTVGDSRCRLSADGNHITTDYEVTVLESLKGPAAVGSTVTVSIPGGRLEFEDGTWAELFAEDFVVPQAGQRYVLFLQPSRYRPTDEAHKIAAPLGVLSPTYGSQGLVFVTPDLLRVYPRGRRIDAIVQEYWEASYNTLLNHTYAMVASMAAKLPE